MLPAATAYQFTPAIIEERLSDLGIPIARLIAAARIARSTWSAWRAGRTRPRPDRWAAATAAFDALVAEAAPAPIDLEPPAAEAAPVTLAGSSPSTGKPPAFRPIATAGGCAALERVEAAARLEAGGEPSAQPGSFDVDPPPAAAVSRDLAALIAAHGPALAQVVEAETVVEAARALFDAEAPPRPPELWWRARDAFHMPRGRVRLPSGDWRQFYDDADADELCEAPEPCSYTTVVGPSPDGNGLAWVPDPARLARKAEILTAHRSWRAACAAVADRVGLTAAQADVRAAAAALQRLEDTILCTPTETIAAAVVKARWIEAKRKVGDWSEFVLYDMLHLGEAVAATEPADGDREAGPMVLTGSCAPAGASPGFTPVAAAHDGASSFDMARNLSCLAHLLQEMDDLCRRACECRERTVWPPAPEALFQRPEDRLWVVDKVVKHQNGRLWYPPM